jgi:hypothetical protein
MEDPARAETLFAAAEGAASMRRWIGYRFLNMGLSLGLGMAMAGSFAAAQEAPKGPTEADVYCSGVATDQAVPADTYLISGENSRYRTTYIQGDNVYINRGAEQGVKVGDEFEVVRPVQDMMQVKWFKWQSQLVRAMGTMYADIGRVLVVNVLAKTSIAQVRLTCDTMQRGDIVRPFAVRPAPAYHDAKFDPFASPSGKKTAMVVTKKNFGQVSGPGATVFVNLGSSQGVQVGDYFRVFRYQGTRNETTYELSGTAYKVYGFGSTPIAYQWDNLPRQVLGEGIVLRTGPNSATVLLTTAREEIFDGDYVELE